MYQFRLCMYLCYFTLVFQWNPRAASIQCFYLCAYYIFKVMIFPFQIFCKPTLFSKNNYKKCTLFFKKFQIKKNIEELINWIYHNLIFFVIFEFDYIDCFGINLNWLFYPYKATLPRIYFNFNIFLILYQTHFFLILLY